MGKKAGAAAGGGGREGRGRAAGTIETRIGPVHVAGYGERIPEEVQDQMGVILIRDGKVYAYPEPDPDNNTLHAVLSEALGWSGDEYDDATRLWVDEFEKLNVAVGAVGWGRESRSWYRDPDTAVDSKAFRKVGRAAKRLISAGYPSTMRLSYWGASGAPIVSQLGEW